MAQLSFGGSTLAAILQPIHRVVDGRSVRPEVTREHEQEVAATIVGQREVRVGDDSRLGSLRHRVVQQEQLGDHFAQARRVALGEARREIERGSSGRAAKPASAQPIEEPA